MAHSRSSSGDRGVRAAVPLAFLFSLMLAACTTTTEQLPTVMPLLATMTPNRASATPIPSPAPTGTATPPVILSITPAITTPPTALASATAFPLPEVSAVPALTRTPQPVQAKIENDSATIQITAAQLNTAIRARFQPGGALQTAPEVFLTNGQIIAPLPIRDAQVRLTLNLSAVRTTRGGALDVTAVGLANQGMMTLTDIKHGHALIEKALIGLIREAVGTNTLDYQTVSVSNGLITISVLIR